MFTVHRKELMWAGRPLVIEAGKVARQADGAVMVTYGETTVLCTAVAQKAPRVGIDFFRLPSTTRRRHSLPAKSRAGSSSVKGAPTKRRR